MALQHSRTVRVPEPVCRGRTPFQAFVVFEKLSFGRSGDPAQAGRQLASLHRTLSPDGRSGFDLDTFVGPTTQPNGWDVSWPDFWDRQRLGHMLRQAKEKGASFPRESELRAKVHAILEQHPVQASLVHGDLWSGNQAWTVDGQYAIFDPAVYYGDREVDLAMTRLFGAQSSTFYQAYLAEFPVDEHNFEIRQVIYNLYHILNHFVIFGPSYLPQANSMIEQILRA
eukprot:gb/GEZN01016940.1/.p1 GENE.gb/GEZN01016940.1/~~gb/GEZN01016940.1/.p1  ORF type:complete len:240 (-),score=21.26 gb/GEZN01016940.1/:101-778(-)